MATLSNSNYSTLRVPLGVTALCRSTGKQGSLAFSAMSWALMCLAEWDSRNLFLTNTFLKETISKVHSLDKFQKYFVFSS